MNKSQLYGQIFIYLLTIFLMFLILIYGYNSINNFRKKAEQISCLKFKNDLNNAIDTMLGDFGSIKRKNLQLCSGFTQVCFVETFKMDRDDAPTQPIDPIILDNIKSQTGRNVFLIDDQNTEIESLYAGNISVTPDVMCIDALQNKISLRLEGRGNHVLLSNWVNS